MYLGKMVNFSPTRIWFLKLAGLFSNVLGGNRSRETWLRIWLILFKAPLTKWKNKQTKIIQTWLKALGIGIISMSISHSLQILKISNCWIPILHQPSTSTPPTNPPNTFTSAKVSKKLGSKDSTTFLKFHVKYLALSPPGSRRKIVKFWNPEAEQKMVKGFPNSSSCIYRCVVFIGFYMNGPWRLQYFNEGYCICSSILMYRIPGFTDLGDRFTPKMKQKNSWLPESFPRCCRFFFV